MTDSFSGFCSCLWPGLGQVIQGRVFTGLGWFVLFWLGIICLILPGIVVWILCIRDAANYRRG